ncbi:hypothetical protein Tco_0383361 [Tanacetum coccineum]
MVVGRPHVDHSRADKEDKCDHSSRLIQLGVGYATYCSCVRWYILTASGSGETVVSYMNTHIMMKVSILLDVVIALGWFLEEIHVTWAHLEKKRTRLRLYTKFLKEIRIQTVEMESGFHATPSGFANDGVRTLAMASKRSRPKETLEDSASQDKEDHSTCA